MTKTMIKTIKEGYVRSLRIKKYARLSDKGPPSPGDIENGKVPPSTGTDDSPRYGGHSG